MKNPLVFLRLETEPASPEVDRARLLAFRCTIASMGLLVGLAMAGGAVAGPKTAHCNAIDDDDQRALCKALATKSGVFCSVIENENLKANCWSQASRKESHCKLAVYDTDYPVIDNVLMTQCKELSRKY